MGRKPKRESPLETQAKSQQEATEEVLIPQNGVDLTTPPDIEAPAEEPSDVPDEFEDVGSKIIARASYNADTQTLIVTFKGSGGVRYGYGNIKPDVWREFYMAESRGAYFNTRIRPLSAGKIL